jgi:hypothetical protein
LALEKKRAKLPSKIPGEGYRIYYCRYADDFIIGINGPKEIADNLKSEVYDFIRERLKLNLSRQKTKVVSAINNRALFLGAHIRSHISRTNDQKRRSDSFTPALRKVRARVPQSQIILLAPLEKITQKLSDQGMCDIKNFFKREVVPKRKVS